MEPHDGYLLDLLLPSFRGLFNLIAPAQLGEPCNHEVSNLVVLGVAGHEEHVSSYAVFEHCFAGDAVIAKSEENPGDVSLNYGVFEGGEGIE